MRERRGVRVVRLIGMAEHAIYKRRFHGAAQHIRAEDRGNFLAAIVPGKLERRLSGHQFRAGNHGGECVHDVVLGFFGYFFRQRAIARFAHVRTEPRHRGADGIRSQRRNARKSRGRDRPACALQQAAAAQVPAVILRR